MGMNKYLTTNELIRELEQYPPDMEIWTANKMGEEEDHSYNTSPFGEKVEPVGMVVKRHIKDQRVVRRPCKETAGAKKVLVFY